MRVASLVVCAFIGAAIGIRNSPDPVASTQRFQFLKLHSRWRGSDYAGLRDRLIDAGKNGYALQQLAKDATSGQHAPSA